eukprot:TRINITY_DN19592_c0_g1_i1.p3 TRINITY_DN19592_c0_g1~~TRINITY_DN19592_c0_g1_i1.p3  ORF type:complete len:125 (+),score=54.03 TRINITY_DN19592_c0_g1_i1:30-377(+)
MCIRDSFQTGMKVLEQEKAYLQVFDYAEQILLIMMSADTPEDSMQKFILETLQNANAHAMDLLQNGQIKECFLLLRKAEKLVIRHASSSKYAKICLLYTSPSPRDLSTSRMPSSA